MPYLKFLVEGMLVSLSAWIGTAGFIAYYFGIFSPVTILANLCIVPLATLITLSGFSLVGIASIVPSASWVCARTCEFFVALLLQTTLFFVKLPGAYFFLARNQ